MPTRPDKPSQSLTAVSLFSGCGGFDLGARRAGVKIVWANDRYGPAADAYQRLHPDVDFHTGDIRDFETFPTADVLIGCYPCQGFSRASRRRWRGRSTRDLKGNDENFLYEEFVRAIGIVNPKYLFVENVEGMRSAVGGWFLEQQINAISNAGEGYAVSSPTVLDANWYGVPQNRRRLFFVGVRNDVELEYKFPRKTHGDDLRHQAKTLFDAIGDETRFPHWPEGEYWDGPFHGHYLTRNRKRGWNQPSYAIVANHSHVPLSPMGWSMQFEKKDTWALRGTRNRRLSWRECAAIQGLPIHAFSETQFLIQKYRLIGNSVPPRLGQVLVRPVVKYESSAE